MAAAVDPRSAPLLLRARQAAAALALGGAAGLLGQVHALQALATAGTRRLPPVAGWQWLLALAIGAAAATALPAPGGARPAQRRALLAALAAACSLVAVVALPAGLGQPAGLFIGAVLPAIGLGALLAGALRGSGSPTAIAGVGALGAAVGAAALAAGWLPTLTAGLQGFALLAIGAAVLQPKAAGPPQRQRLRGPAALAVGWLLGGLLRHGVPLLGAGLCQRGVAVGGGSAAALALALPLLLCPALARAPVPLGAALAAAAAAMLTTLLATVDEPLAAAITFAVLALPLAPVLARAGTELPRLLLGGLAGAAAVEASMAFWPALPTAAMIAAVGAALLVRQTRWAWLALFTAILAAVFGAPRPAADGAVSVLARLGADAAQYVRSRQELQLAVAGSVVDGHGPDRRGGDLLAGLLALLRPDARHPVVLGLGDGRVAAAVGNLSRGDVDIVCHGDTDLLLLPALNGDGPVPVRPAPSFAPPAGGRLLRMGLRRYLRSARARTRDAAVLAVPLSVEPWLSTEEFHFAARQALGAGPLLLGDRLEALSAEGWTRALAAASAVHPSVSVFVVHGDVAVVCAAAPPDLAAAAAAWSALTWPQRWRLHAAGLGAGSDLDAAFVGALLRPLQPGLGSDDALPAAPRDAAPSAAAAAAALQQLLGRDGATVSPVGALRLQLLAATPPPDAVRAVTALAATADGCVLRDDLRALRRRHVRAAIAGCPLDDAAAAADVSALAATFCHLGAPGAELQAALGLPTLVGERLLSPATAALNALAMDPTFAATAPPLLRPVMAASSAAGRSPLEDFAALPPAARLLELCVGDGAPALALRARFASACAEALVGGRVERAWTPAESTALRELADPFVLAAAAAVLAPQGAERELIALWRRDLPLPGALRRLAVGSGTDRRRIAEATIGHEDPASLLLIADLLCDADLLVRTAAGTALSRCVGAAIPYDPNAPETERRAAAERLRALHNRTP